MADTDNHICPDISFAELCMHNLVANPKFSTALSALAQYWNPSGSSHLQCIIKYDEVYRLGTDIAHACYVYPCAGTGENNYSRADHTVVYIHCEENTMIKAVGKLVISRDKCVEAYEKLFSVINSASHFAHPARMIASVRECGLLVDNRLQFV